MNRPLEILKIIEGGCSEDSKEQTIYLNALNCLYTELISLKLEAEEQLIKKVGKFQEMSKGAGYKQFEYKDAKEAFCVDEIKYDRNIELLMKSISKQMSNLITTISYSKQEMAMNNQSDRIPYIEDFA